MPMRRKRLWVWGRRLCQLAMLALFLWMFRAMEYGGEQTIGHHLSLWFRADPLIAAAATLAGKAVIATLLPALVLVVLTALLGRFFCGWICPLGTLLDLFHRLVRRPARWTRARLRLTSPRLQTLKHGLLVVVLLAAALNVMLLGFFDPLVLLYRGLTVAVDPLVAQGADDASLLLYDHGPAWVTAVSEPTYAFLADHVLPFQRATFATAWLSGILLLVIFLLEFADRRFWCRNLCPLGSMLGLIGRASVVRRLPVKVCGHCGQCSRTCRMGAFDVAGRFQPEACNLCMDCVGDCPSGIAKLSLRRPRTAPAPVQVSRRTLLGAGVAGVLVPLTITGVNAAAASRRRPQLRPPGVTDEDAFLDLCVRCGACMKVCPTNGLQPQMLESGIDGLLAPKLVPRLGYCEYHCTLCGQVCPTGAIPRLAEPVKVAAVLGLAEIDTGHCLPWADNEGCVGCEEMCPIPEKAIRTEAVDVVVDGETRTVMRPHVIADRCIGCGICEHNCPLDRPAIVVRPRPAAA